MGGRQSLKAQVREGKASVEPEALPAYLRPVNNQPLSEMSTRARDVFRVVVENYLGTGTPVGSRTISKLAGLNLSPAAKFTVVQ